MGDGKASKNQKGPRGPGRVRRLRGLTPPNAIGAFVEIWDRIGNPLGEFEMMNAMFAVFQRCVDKGIYGVNFGDVIARALDEVGRMREPPAPLKPRTGPFR